MYHTSRQFVKRIAADGEGREGGARRAESLQPQAVTNRIISGRVTTDRRVEMKMVREPRW